MWEAWSSNTRDDKCTFSKTLGSSTKNVLTYEFFCLKQNFVMSDGELSGDFVKFRTMPRVDVVSTCESHTDSMLRLYSKYSFETKTTINTNTVDICFTF